jgi:hypothetical protein
MSQYLMLLLFAAADAIHDKGAPIDWPTVDVIMNRNGRRKVLRSPFLLHTNEPCFCGSGSPARLEVGMLTGHRESDVKSRYKDGG